MVDALAVKLSPKPVVYTYQDFRRFIADQIIYLKQHSISLQKVTLQNLSRACGFKSHNLLGRVIKGERNLTLGKLARLCEVLELDSEESAFFSDLVLLNQAKTQEERRFYSQRIINSRRFQKAYPLKKSQMRYLSDWYLPAIRELVTLQDFIEDPEWIASRLTPQITAAQAARGLKDLLELGMIERNPQGKLQQTSTAIDTGDEMISPLLPEFHKSMIKMSLQAVDGYNRDSRNLQAVTVSLSPERYNELWKLMTRFRQEVVSLATAEDPATGVFQVNFQLFPLALPEVLPLKNSKTRGGES